jgi:hypothetical protein
MLKYSPLCVDKWGMRWCCWLRHCATSRQVVGLIADSSGRRRGSAADRLLELRVRILPWAWMIVLYVVSKGKMQDKTNKYG